MPAPVTSPSSIRTANNAATLKPRSQGQVKKKRIVRRRGRTQGDLGSDDEIEREYGTDSESEDELSSLDSASDSDTEPASEDVIPNGHARSFTPSTSQSPGDRGLREKESVTEHFFTPAGNWSEMVADENAHGPADLPVIEFADFAGQASVPSVPQPRKATKAKKPVKTVRPAAEVTVTLPAPQATEADSTEIRESVQFISTSHHISSSSFERRPTGQTARQAYQQRLESDPSYVPTVGGFWGHDDRLLDKDLRSLSGWWRGRWQGRGRGRGFIRGRGRGGFFRAHSPQPNGDGQFEEAESDNTHDLPPIERAWTHDGFEELRDKEEQRRAAQRASPQAQGSQTVGGFRGGRGGSVIRGGRGGFNRGGFVAPSGRTSRATSGRVWYPMKPELMWTKQHEGFLYFEQEPALKPRYGQGPGIIVKLPGKQSQPKVIRAPPRSYPIIKVPTTKPATASVLGSDLGERTYLVRLPKRSGKEKAAEPAGGQGETPIDEVFKVRPSLVQRKPLPPPKRAATLNGISMSPPPPSSHVHLDISVATSSQSRHESSIRSQLEYLSLEQERPDPARLAKTEEAVLKRPSPEVQADELTAVTSPPEAVQPPPLSTLQTVFTPPLSQPSPVYGSPYGYAPTLPPGIAMNQHGMPYELATGRPVYLQAPPPPMYNPRPIMHSHLQPSSVPFVPGHMHHHSAISPDFLAPSASNTPPMNGFIDPTTGTPIFSFPRQTSRIEIRAPSENGSEVKSPGGRKSSSSSHRPSGLRTTAMAFEPSRSISDDSSVGGYFPTLAAPADMGSLPSYASVDGIDGGMANGEQAMLAYPQYPQYYYPDAYGGYAPYMDMSQMGQYEMYPQDGVGPPQGAVYY
ncbi:hypothetical protein Hypma_012828 [Hypsizygus marmoreus]|uniref:Btz domain-containing protein n=1 Tax=Hypsizygus marmoreus TaxID=39966 RepID=A0A369JFV8_HYPMA|nr:hypothetical protein Hypma_012828 [Hypsizygus marmoreus]